MKIALLTIWHVENYGAELQAYATCRILTELGHDVTIIDFRENEHPNESFKNKLARSISSCTLSHFKFAKFWKKYFPNKTRHYRSYEELKATPPEADLYLVGSDQVWNYKITAEKAEAFFLTFGSDDMKRASYASSFGMDKWNASEQLSSIAKRMLNKFSAVSCRETSGIKILKEQFNIDATEVLDPTMLFDEYFGLNSQNVMENKSLAYYPLSTNNELETFSIDLARKLGLYPNNINKKVLITNTIAWNRPSVYKWVEGIARASLVVTPSFHGLVFSLLFRKQFIIINNNINQERKVRMTDLLNKLGLENRYFDSIDSAKVAKPWEQTINYDNVYPKLLQMRSASINYLHKMLQL